MVGCSLVKYRKSCKLVYIYAFDIKAGNSLFIIMDTANDSEQNEHTRKLSEVFLINRKTRPFSFHFPASTSSCSAIVLLRQARE